MAKKFHLMKMFLNIACNFLHDEKSLSSHELIKILKDAGFVLDWIKGSHHIYIHSENKKRAVVPHPKKDLPYGTSSTILKQAGIE